MANFPRPTSFAPIIEMAMKIVEQSGGQYHILVIIADDQVTRVDAECGKLSPQEQKTVNAIVQASKFPFSIILVGVGDGPWDMMKKFDDNIPARDFDNFEFLHFTDIMTKDIPASQKEAAFALAALMEIPSQFTATLELKLLSRKANAPHVCPLLPPPIHDSSSSNSGNSRPVGITRRATSFSYDNKVTEALAGAGLESCNLIVGIDFTKSNEWTGAKSFNRQSLHHIGYGLNPYEQAISIIGKTLAAFVEDNVIPCFGFGDATTDDQDVFSFSYPQQRFCNGFEEVLSRYREIVPHLHLAGPTSFVPIIEMAMTIVEKSGGQYHVLVIITDGQLCFICRNNSKDMAFGCGHQTCCECGQNLQSCPFCRSPIHIRIKLY